MNEIRIVAGVVVVLALLALAAVAVWQAFAPPGQHHAGGSP
jgi:hypothetical protein